MRRRAPLGERAMSKFALVVDQRGAALEPGTHDTVLLRHADGRIERVGLRALNSVVLNGDVMVSTQLLRSMSAHGIGIVMLPIRGQAAALSFARQPLGMVRLRHAQHQCVANPASRLELARTLVLLKLESQFALQRRLGLRDAKPSEAEAAQLATQVATAPDRASLMGLEGARAREHFGLLAHFLCPDWRFAGRSKRPPRDPFNALLSLGYTLAREEAQRVALRLGLDVELGFLHEARGNRGALSLDLLEPARAAVEQWLLEGVQAGIWTPAGFRDNDADGCRLEKPERLEFYREWFAHGQRRAALAVRPALAAVLAALRHRAGASQTEAMEEGTWLSDAL